MTQVPRGDDPSLPRFDAPGFAAWLRRYRDAEHLEWKQIAVRSGIHYSTLMNVARGANQRIGARTDPSATTLARLAHGLGLDFNYVAFKAGLLPGGDVSRFAAFSTRERETLLAGLMYTSDERLRAELRATLPTADHPQEDT